MRNGGWLQGELDLKEVCLHRVFGVESEGGYMLGNELSRSFALLGSQAILRVELDGVQDGQLLLGELCDVVGRGLVCGFSCSLRVDGTTDVVLGVEESNWLMGWNGVFAPARVEDLEREGALLYRGAPRDDLRRLFQSSAIWQSVDDA